MRRLFYFVSVLLISTAQADTTPPPQIFYAWGPSIPSSLQSSPTYDPTALTRVSGGERFTITSYSDSAGTNKLAFEVNSVILVAYSTSGQGQILVHAASAINDLSGSSAVTPLTGLVTYQSGDQCSNENGNVFLSNGQTVRVDFPSPISVDQVGVTLEAFGNDDASALLIMGLSDAASDLFSARVNRQIVNPPPSSGGGGGGDGGSRGSSGGICQQCGSFQVCVGQGTSTRCVGPGGGADLCHSDSDCGGSGSGFSCQNGRCSRD